MYRILTFTQEIFDSMASGKQTDVAVMDFSKAFDKLDHQRLIHKLKRMGINNKTSNWIGAWQGLKLRKYFRCQVGPHQINFGSPHNLLGAHQARIARLPPRLQGALWRGVC